ncbi:MAG: alpha-1,2-fucosyltransferase [Bacteroidia bacterium]
MIIVKLMGGLGNQLFQYAFGKAMALKHGVQLKVDVSGIGDHAGYTSRELELAHFDKHITIASEKELEPYQKGKLSKIMDLASLSVGLNSGSMYVREPHFHFSALAMKAPEDAYLDGYWQSEKYFAAVKNELIALLTDGVSLSQKSAGLADQMQKENSVAIHVRKGDYVSVKQNQEIYAALDGAYYLAAIEYIKTHVKDPVFYIFSDEPDWFTKNIKANVPVVNVTDNRGSSSYQDLFLMSCCKHNIIANSSFSWWGAWLNKHPQKIVIAPEKWFNGPSKNAKDLIPENWIKL